MLRRLTEVDGGLALAPLPVAAGLGADPALGFANAGLSPTATAHPLEHVPQIEQVSDDRLAIVYSYMEDGQGSPPPEGRALSTFTWNDDTQSVDHEGDFPPGVR